VADTKSFDHFRVGEPIPGLDNPAADATSFNHFRAGEPYPDITATVSASLIKTFIGLLRASTKTVDGVTQTTGVKTWVGLANT